MDYRLDTLLHAAFKLVVGSEW